MSVPDPRTAIRGDAAGRPTRSFAARMTFATGCEAPRGARSRPRADLPVMTTRQRRDIRAHGPASPNPCGENRNAAEVSRRRFV